MRSIPALSACAALIAVLTGTGARAALTLQNQFNPGLGQLVGLAHDAANGSVWVYGASDPDLRQYATDGTFLGAVPRPGESANDFDLEVAPEALILAGTAVPAGTLLVINGESGVAEVYAVDKVSGAVLATLTTAFGGSHVVGGAWHAGRNTLFLVEDNVPSGTANDNIVAEVDAATGAVLGSFKVDSVLPGFTVSFGDVEVSAVTGNLFVASSAESSVAEFTPSGTLVQIHALPAGISSLSGLGLDDAGNVAWASQTNGVVSSMAGFPWTTLGAGVAGTAGLPVLTGSGSLVAGTPTLITLTKARPAANAFIIAGFTQANLPFMGGTLMPFPDVVVGLPTDASGGFALPFAWPAGLPSGFALHYQVWISDPVGPKGFAATNGLKSVTP